jgi:hypothetical protein
MDKKRIALLYAHQKNIERYENLLRTTLGKHETQYLEKRLAEERFAMSMLRCMSPQSTRQRRQFPEALE